MTFLNIQNIWKIIEYDCKWNSDWTSGNPRERTRFLSLGSLVKKHRASDAQNRNDPEHVFIGVKEKQLLKDIQAGENRNYKRVIDGEEKELIVSPPLFQFNSRIGVQTEVDL